jgi:hypothetical protein
MGNVVQSSNVMVMQQAGFLVKYYLFLRFFNSYLSNWQRVDIQQLAWMHQLTKD